MASFVPLLQRVDTSRLCAIERARHLWEIRKRLGYANAPRHLKALQPAEQRCLDGEPAPIRPRVVAIASPVTEDRIERYQAHHSRTPVAGIGAQSLLTYSRKRRRPKPTAYSAAST
jgi:hypothetical protein